MIKYRRNFVAFLITTIIGFIIFNGLFIGFCTGTIGYTFSEFFTNVIPDTIKTLFDGFLFTSKDPLTFNTAWTSIVGMIIMVVMAIMIIYSLVVFIVKKRKRYIVSLAFNVVATYAVLIVLCPFISNNIAQEAIQAKDSSVAIIISTMVFGILTFLLSVIMMIKALQASYTLKKANEMAEVDAVTTDASATDMDGVIVPAIGEEKEPEIEEEPDDGKFSVKKIVNKVKKATKKATNKVQNKIKAKKVYHISKRASDGLWVIKYAGGEKVIKTFPTKKEAVAYSETLAANQGAVVLTHASKGKNQGKIYEKVNTNKKTK